MTAETKPYFVTLPDRAIIRASGPDTHAFLQNLITNDMDLLNSQPMIYAHLLTPQGKFLFDFFISRNGEDYLIECEGGQRAEDLLKKFTMYKLRSKINLTLQNNQPVYMIIGTNDNPDPRHPELGHRTLTKPEQMNEQPFGIWDKLRISHGVPDGSRDMVTDKSTMIESRMDVFHAVSFTKGCYIGQEITARMHNRGLAKKHLIAVKITGEAPDQGSDIVIDGHVVGEMRSSCGDIGIALIRDDAHESLKDSPIIPI